MHILITAGGTREYIDPVRFISNASTGKMGFALAKAATKAGHKVTLITAPTSIKPPKVHKLTKVRTAAEMFLAVAKHFARCDCLIMAAAVSDYTLEKPSKSKIKKGNKNITLTLKPTTDILEWAGKHKYGSRVTGHGSRKKIVVGFALEDGNIKANAEKKLIAKNLDMIIANHPAAIGADKTTVWVKRTGSDWERIENTTKAAIAKKIIRLVEKTPISQ